jgi:hypothetical protein
VPRSWRGSVNRSADLPPAVPAEPFPQAQRGLQHDDRDDGEHQGRTSDGTSVRPVTCCSCAVPDADQLEQLQAPRVGGVSGPEQTAADRPEDDPAPRVTPRPERAPDDSDIGWGERLTDPDDDDRRYLEDRPPHWGSD